MGVTRPLSVALSRLYVRNATRNDFVKYIVDDERADAIFATLKTIVDDGSSTISLRVAGPLLASRLLFRKSAQGHVLFRRTDDVTLHDTIVNHN